MVNMEKLPPDAYSTEDLELFNKLTEKNILTLLIYNRKVLCGGKSYSIIDRPELRDGIITAPAEIFTLLEGVTLNENVLTCGECSLDLCKCDLRIPLYERCGKIYVPVSDIAEALEFSHICLYQGRVIAVGVPADIEKLSTAVKNNSALGFAAAAAVTGKYDAC